MIKIEVDHGKGELETKGTGAEICTDTLVVLRAIRDTIREDIGEEAASTFEEFITDGEAARFAFQYKQEGGTTNAN